MILKFTIESVFVSLHPLKKPHLSQCYTLHTHNCVQMVTRGDKKKRDRKKERQTDRERNMSHHGRKLAASSIFCRLQVFCFTIVIELGMPHISAGWQGELAGVVYGEMSWQARGVTCGVNWKNRTNPLFCQRHRCDIHHG